MRRGCPEGMQTTRLRRTWLINTFVLGYNKILLYHVILTIKRCVPQCLFQEGAARISCALRGFLRNVCDQLP